MSAYPSATLANRHRSVRRRAGLAVAAALTLALPAVAGATTYFTATASSDSSFTLNDVLFEGFSFNFYDVRFSSSCGPGCITATSGNGTPLGSFNMILSGSPWSYLVDPL